MSAARIIKPPPMSGGDRKYYAREIHKAEVTFANLLQQAATAHAAADDARAKAYALDCAAWNAALFIGEFDHVSPTIAAAIKGGFALLEVRCEHCKHTEIIDLALVVQPRDRQVALMRSYLYYGSCQRALGKKRRPDLIGLRPIGDPQPTAPSRRTKKAS
ncbi:hypothetical protein JQ580_33460 [Bradyrhizobium japonicum]|jgi:hypothetical protein|uniref:hypothetical protein n=1 Tax=Bradyrhizobium japonicum TaxID=375 RepID=UPI001BA8307F|nr:hypothetical protein [Bradyrhizobium japonicum]MBR0995624.1 hypothetical protein [Bradyrhizobium japonicum]